MYVLPTGQPADFTTNLTELFLLTAQPMTTVRINDDDDNHDVDDGWYSIP